jgi:hypothetical protein
VQSLLTEFQSDFLKDAASLGEDEPWYCCSFQAFCQLLLLECMQKHCGNILIIYENSVEVRGMPTLHSTSSQSAQA